MKLEHTTYIVALVCFEVRAYLFFTFIPVAGCLVVSDEMLAIPKKFKHHNVRVCLRVEQGNRCIRRDNTCDTLVVHKYSIKTSSHLVNQTVGLSSHCQVGRGVCMHQLQDPNDLHSVEYQYYHRTFFRHIIHHMTKTARQGMS